MPVMMKQKKNQKREAKLSTFCHRINKRTAEEVGVGSTLGHKAKLAVAAFANDLLHRLSSEAASVASLHHRRTVSTRDALAAVKITLNGDLRSHAVSMGQAALQSRPIMMKKKAAEAAATEAEEAAPPES